MSRWFCCRHEIVENMFRSNVDIIWKYCKTLLCTFFMAADCIQPGTKAMIKDGIAKITNKSGFLKRCLCCRNCSSKIFRWFYWVCAAVRTRAVLIIMIIAFIFNKRSRDDFMKICTSCQEKWYRNNQLSNCFTLSLIKIWHKI